MYELVNEIWIVRFQPSHGRSFFRTFTKFGMLLTTVQKGMSNKSSVWETMDWQAFYFNLSHESASEVTSMIQREAVLHVPTEEEWEADEPNTVPHY
jgi:hypothetical protein